VHVHDGGRRQTTIALGAVEGVQVVRIEFVERYGPEGRDNPAVDLLAVLMERFGGAAIALDLGQPVDEERAEGCLGLLQ
jgi:hypothetical protein